jgi:hypothetical protein
MNKTLLSILSVGAVCVVAGNSAQAGPGDDVMARLAALEKENAALAKENTALRTNRKLQRENASLKSSQVPAAQGHANATPNRDPLAAYAADLPTAYKARPIEAPGQFRVWGEGGAIWSGGDPRSTGYSLTNFTSPFGASSTGSFDQTPKLGWEAAGGFDYRFANSPWHVSGQFRYGQGGKVSDSAASAGAADPALLAALNGPPGLSFSGSQSVAAGYNETHWLADLAVGRDIFGSGASAMQVKLGVRMAEVSSKADLTDRFSQSINFGAPLNIGGGFPPVTAIDLNVLSTTAVRSSFFGVGPRVGIEGSVPFAGNWTFDYLGDVAVLFGTQRMRSAATQSVAITPAFLAAIGGINFGGGSINAGANATDERTATVVNADLQAGVSYWMTPNLKLSASYRIDAYLNVLNTTFAKTTKATIDRYTHGPRFGVSAQF